MPKGLSHLHFSFTEDHLTHHGGMALIQRFCCQLGLRRRLQRSVPLAQTNRSYSPSDLFLGLMYAVIAGLRRINKTEILQYTGTFLTLLGMDQFPDQSTLRRFLKRLPLAAIRQLARLHDQLRQHWFFLPQPRSSLTFAPDTVILTNYGYKEGARHWEVGEFRYQPHGWRSPHRFVVVRCPIPKDPVESRQLTLFKDRKYVYHVLVTKLQTHSWRVWLFYDQRANIEKDIRELLYDYPLATIPTDDWTANLAFFQIVLFAFNLVLWFKRLCLPREYQHATLDTVRTDFLVLLAQLSHKDNRNVLLLPRGHHQQQQFLAACKKIARLQFKEKL